LQVVEAVSGKQQGHGSSVDGSTAWHAMLAKQHLAQEATDGPAAGLTRGHSRPSVLAQVRDQPFGLGCGPRAVNALQDDESAASQGFIH
jgi:hypothetical protein